MGKKVSEKSKKEIKSYEKNEMKNMKEKKYFFNDGNKNKGKKLR